MPNREDARAAARCCSWYSSARSMASASWLPIERSRPTSREENPPRSRNASASEATGRSPKRRGTSAREPMPAAARARHAGPASPDRSWKTIGPGEPSRPSPFWEASRSKSRTCGSGSSTPACHMVSPPRGARRIVTESAPNTLPTVSATRLSTVSSSRDWLAASSTSFRADRSRLRSKTSSLDASNSRHELLRSSVFSCTRSSSTAFQETTSDSAAASLSRTVSKALANRRISPTPTAGTGRSRSPPAMPSQATIRRLSGRTTLRPASHENNRAKANRIPLPHSSGHCS